MSKTTTVQCTVVEVHVKIEYLKRNFFNTNSTKIPSNKSTKGPLMAEPLEKQIEAMLRNGESKKKIFTKLDNQNVRARLLFYLNNNSLLSRRHKYMWVNLFLGITLLAMTIRLLLSVADTIAQGGVGWYLLADFIVPTINFYILRELFLFHRTGYQFLIILTSLSLFYSSNRVMPDLFVNIGMIALGAFLYLKLFPKNEILKIVEK